MAGAFGGIKKAIEAKLVAALSEEGNKIAQNARSKASWSKDIPGAISTGQVTKTTKGFEILIKVDLKKAPQAAAYEFGSGIHATKGDKGTYKILPKNAAVLAFQWNPANPIGALNSPKVIDYVEDKDLWLFREVDHPGVAPRPFLAPALAETRLELKTKFLNVLSSAFRGVSTRVEIK